MTKNAFLTSLFTILTVSLTLFQSCYIDQVENKYSDYASADKDGLFEKGWIPIDLTFKSMTEIYLRTNLDINTCIFSFKLAKTDIETVKQNVHKTNTDFKKPPRIRTPSGWTKAVDKLDSFVFISTDKRDSIYLVIDEKGGKIYGWRS